MVKVRAPLWLPVLVVCGSAAAQTPERDAGVFRIYQGSAEIGRETFSDDGTTQHSTVVIPIAGLKVVSEITRVDGRSRHATFRAFNPATDSLARTYTASVDGDSVRLSQLTVRSGEHRQWARRAAPDEITAEQSVAGLVWLIQHAGRRAQTWQVWFPSADSTLTMQVEFRADTVDIGIGPQRLRAVLGADGRVQTLAQLTSPVRFERFTGDSLPPLAGVRRPAPDYAAPAGAPYTAEQVRVPVHPARGDSFSLGCTLTRPLDARARVPAAITLTGSGLQDRDENLWPLVPDYHLYRQVAARLAQAGIAVLRCDDRGFGASAGAVDSATMLDFADDAAAQLAWLRARADVDSSRLAVIGHSEGGIVGPMVAARDRRLAALVVIAGTSKTMAAVVRDQFLYPVETATGLTAAQRDSARAAALRAADAFVSAPLPYLRQARDYDPLPTARAVRQAVLIVQGAVDRQVSAGQADTLGAALRAGGNRDVTVRVFPGLNHLLLVSPSGTGAGSEYVSLPDPLVPADVLDTIAEWLRARLVPAAGRAGVRRNR